MKLFWRTAAGVCGAVLFAGGLAGVSAEVQSNTARQGPPPPRSTQNLAAPEVRDQEMVTCKGIQLYYTARGVAFTCADFQQNINSVIVIDDSQFAGGGAAMVPVLDRLAQASRDYIMDPQKPGISLKVRHRDASTNALAVCTIMQRRSPGNKECREAVYFYF